MAEEAEAVRETGTPADTEPTVNLRVTRENLVALPALAPYFAFGLVGFVAGPLFLTAAADALDAGVYRHPHILAAVHLYALGWGTSVALGALQQMTAVVFATVLHSPRLALVAFVSFAAGTVGLLVGFLTFSREAFIVAAVGLPIGIMAVVINVVFTLLTGRPTVRGILIEPYVRSAVSYLVLTVTAGAALAINLGTGLLGPFWNAVFPLHVGVAAAGWFLMLVIGISYHLLTFFGLVNKRFSFRWPTTVRYLVHGGIGFAVVGSVMHGSAWSVPAVVLSAIGLVLAAAGIGFFLWDSRMLFVEKTLRRMHVVVGYVRLAHVYLGLVAVGLGVAAVAFVAGGWAGTTAVGGKVYTAIGVIAAAGWLPNTILGYLHRILPFFVWHNKYWGRGKEPGVPAFRDMVNVPLAWSGLIVYNIGVMTTIAAVAADWSLAWPLGAMGAGAVLASGNLVWTLFR